MRLPNGWHQNLAAIDREWIGRTLFVGKGKLTNSLKLWWHPPAVKYSPVSLNLDTRRLLLWAPRMMWKIKFHCPRCGVESLRSKGLYNCIRLVLDVKCHCYMAGEYMDCRACSGTFISWDRHIVCQLADGVQARFQVVLTRMYACDQVLRRRGLGNSPSALQSTLHELHSEEWLRSHLDHLTNCQRHKKGLSSLNLAIPNYQQPAPPPSFLKPQWFLAAYVRCGRGWTSFWRLQRPSILKIDSTNKVCKKLQGADAGTAAWTTNVGNERGEIFQSVLTASESFQSLKMLADGLVQRYTEAQQPPPDVLYTDRDCCSSRFCELFSA